MPDIFNPYAAWLGLPTDVTSPDHFQLLSIDESVDDPAAIASAADRAMTRVRSHKPGPQAAAWAQLLDRIAAAKATLTDPAQRQSYIQQLSTPAALTAAPVDPSQLPRTPGATYPIATQLPAAGPPLDRSLDPMAPVVVGPQGVAPQLSQPAPAAAIPMAVPYLQPATPTLAPPNPMAPVTNSVPMAPTAPAVAQAMPNPMAPLAPAAPVAQAIPVSPPPPMAPRPATPYAAQPSAPAASPMLAARPVATAQPQAFDDAPKLKRKSTATARVRSKSGGLLGPILLGGSVGGLILVVVGVAVMLSDSKPKPSSRPVAAAPPATLPANGGEVASTIPRRLDEIPESERPRPEAFTLPTTSPPPVEPMPQPTMEPTPPTTPTSVTPPPTTPTPTPTPEPMPEPGPSREEIKALAQALTTARAAIGEQNFPIAEREIAKALPLAKTDEHKAMAERLQLLNDYVVRFRKAISETLARFGGGDQIDFGDGTTIGIVEVTPDLLVIRVGGENRRYPMADLPPGLAIRLGEMSLDKASLDTVVLKAAFIAVNPKIGDDDLAKVQAWWQEAASVGDVPDLIAAINDDYSLKQDVMAVPLAPNAMAELTARADRLKDARTIDAFAKEYQAAIDESLKTLEAEMELTVGGSTSVTIKEVKADRVMLTVAEETRGFLFSKLPLGLASSIAERILPRDAPLTMVMKGAYYAAREKDQSSKQFRPFVLDWWKQAGEMDQQLQPVILELVKQYPE